MSNFQDPDEIAEIVMLNCYGVLEPHEKGVEVGDLLVDAEESS
jgi:hypothetical protein